MKGKAPGGGAFEVFLYTGMVGALLGSGEFLMAMMMFMVYLYFLANMIVQSLKQALAPRVREDDKKGEALNAPDGAPQTEVYATKTGSGDDRAEGMQDG
ncbi:MAG: hypothetical protein OEY64_03180 [Nitrospinota bacterium]|nr:hypothetical protein [Nitrospinota bacterium]